MAPYKPTDEYEPRQRGMVECAKQARGNRYLRDGDPLPQECPACGCRLRVRRERGRQIMAWCPCGHEHPVTEEGE